MGKLWHGARLLASPVIFLLLVGLVASHSDGESPLAAVGTVTSVTKQLHKHILRDCSVVGHCSMSISASAPNMLFNDAFCSTVYGLKCVPLQAAALPVQTMGPNYS